MCRMVVSLWLVASPLWAANPGDGSRSTPQSRVEAQNFTRQLLAVAQVVEANYLRPVEQKALLDAAMCGLYEAVREPFPPAIRAELAGAKTPSDFQAVVFAARLRLGEVEALAGSKGLVIGLTAMTRALDPYCGLPSRSDARRGSLAPQSYSGIGVELEPESGSRVVSLLPTGDLDVPIRASSSGRRGPVRFVDVLPGGPAQRAGLRPGDLLTRVDGRDLLGPATEQILQQFVQLSERGGKTAVKLTIRRPGIDEPLIVAVAPAQFMPETVFGVQRRPDHSWDYLLDRAQRIGYLRQGFIDHSSPDEMEAALTELHAGGLRGLILDFRSCPGGFVDPAVAIAGHFVKSGNVATVTSRDETKPRQPLSHVTEDKVVIEGIPIVVLVNGETKGGGELIAAALQDHKIATVIGQRTFGKGSVQTTKPVPAAGLEFKLTSGMFTRPSGKNLHRFADSRPSDDWGVRPDLALPVTPELTSQLREWMRLQVLRPGDSRELLPLDDPENDPVRQFAVRELLKRLKYPPRGQK